MKKEKKKREEIKRGKAGRKGMRAHTVPGFAVKSEF